MAKKKQNIDPIVEVKDLIKKQLMLELFNLNLSQGEIAKKLRMDVHAVNDFLKGLKKNNYEKIKRTKNGYTGTN